MVRGDTARIQLYISDPDGNEYVPEVGDVIRFATKKTYLDTTPAIVKDIDTGTLILEIAPIDTKDLQMGGTKGQYVYDIELTKADGTVDTFIRGDLMLLEEVM